MLFRFRLCWRGWRRGKCRVGHADGGLAAAELEKAGAVARKISDRANGDFPREIWLLPARFVVFNQWLMSLTHPLTTTTFELPGYRITKSFGVVRGIMVRSRSVVGNFGASIQAIFGGNISIYTNL